MNIKQEFKFIDLNKMDIKDLYRLEKNMDVKMWKIHKAILKKEKVLYKEILIH